MRIVKPLVILFFLILIGAAAIHLAYSRNLIPDTLLDGKPYQLAQQISIQTDTAITTIQPTIQKVQEVNTHSGVVLGSIVQVNEADENKQPHEKALDYAQYMYCKQVVDQWDEAQATKQSIQE